MPKKDNAPALVAVCHPDRKHIAKGLCKRCYDAAYQAANKERVNARKRAWCEANPESRRATHRRHLYGIDQATVNAKLKAQDGLCKVCMEAPAAHVDHDHSTGKVRGLLCGNCNRGLGLFRDDRDRLLRAAAYLDLYSDQPQGLLREPLLQRVLAPAVQVRPNTGELVGQSTRGLT